MADVERRLVTLEVTQKHMTDHLTGLEDLVKEHLIMEERDRKEILKKLATMELARSGDRRFIGGIVFTITCLWAVIMAGVALFLKLWGQQ